MTTLLDYKFDTLSKFFIYDETSPSCLLWKVDRIKIKPLTPAGSKVWSDKQRTKPKCWDVRFLGNLYKAHRIVYCLHYGDVDPEMSINHIDTNPFNNHISNLELVSQKINMQKTKQHMLQSVRSDNSTGVVGVSKCSVEGKTVSYAASYTENTSGRRKVFTFPVSTFGEDLAFQLAVTARKFKILEQVSLGAAYPTHNEEIFVAEQHRIRVE